MSWSFRTTKRQAIGSSRMDLHQELFEPLAGFPSANISSRQLCSADQTKRPECPLVGSFYKIRSFAASDNQRTVSEIKYAMIKLRIKDEQWTTHLQWIDEEKPPYYIITAIQFCSRIIALLTFNKLFCLSVRHIEMLPSCTNIASERILYYKRSAVPHCVAWFPIFTCIFSAVSIINDLLLFNRRYRQALCVPWITLRSQRK